jgi:glycosyltransferase involved in cell wall biosynthesis
VDPTRTPVCHEEPTNPTTPPVFEHGARRAAQESLPDSASVEVVVEDSRFDASPGAGPHARPRSARRARVRTVSVVIPAFNEAGIIQDTVGRVTRAVADHRDVRYEVIVVDDGSRDSTAEAARKAGARVISHPYNIGNGAAVKTGIRHARGDYVVCLDGDGQHRPEYIPIMVDRLDRYHMVVGARDRSGQASVGRAVANWIYNRFAAYITSFPIVDLTSGFRAMRADVVRRFLYLLPNTFSYPTTITLSLLRAGFSVHYLPMVTDARQGRSKINPWEDGARFFMILVKIATLFAPLRIFLPLAAVIFSAGLGYYLYTFFTVHRFTNMGVLLMVLSFLMFSLGLISEQIAQLRFDRSED